MLENLENNIFTFYLSREVKPTEANYPLTQQVTRIDED